MALSTYVSAAFWLRPELPGLGRVPLNIVGLIGCAVLTVAHPAFALIGLGLECAYLTWLVSSMRFRRWVDANDLQRRNETAEVEARRQALIATLTAEDARRQAALEQRCTTIIRIAASHQQGELVIHDPAPALNRLGWIHLKLLIARHTLNAELPSDGEAVLLQRAAALEHELSDSTLGETLRNSKRATLEITRRRLDNMQRRRSGLAEIDAELARIDAQLDLALEDAALRDQPATLASHLDFATRELESGSFGVNQDAVADLDRAFALTPPLPAARIAT